MIIFFRIPLFNLRFLINDVATNMRMVSYGTYHYNAFIPLRNILSIKFSLAHLNASVLTSVCEIQNGDLCKRSTVQCTLWTSVAHCKQCSSNISVFFKADTRRAVCALIRGYAWPAVSLVDNEALWKRFHKFQFFNIFWPYKCCRFYTLLHKNENLWRSISRK